MDPYLSNLVISWYPREVTRMLQPYLPEETMSITSYLKRDDITYAPNLAYPDVVI